LLSPKPDWGNPWYYRASAKVNYTTKYKLFFDFGGDLMGSLYQDVPSHYFGVGFDFGIGYKINEMFYVVITNTNSSVLFNADNYRVLRGQIFQAFYTF